MKIKLLYYSYKIGKEYKLMKKMLMKALTVSAPAIAALMVFMAKIFAAAPCMGTYYEPKMPESLVK